MSVVEVAVWLGDTLLEVRQVGATDRYRIGTAPGVDLAVAGLGSFPLIDAGCVMRRPAGITAMRGDGTAIEATEIRLVRGDAIAMTIGLLALRVAMSEAPAPIARGAVDVKPLAFAGGSLAVHLAVWAIAVGLAEPERHGVPVEYANVASVPLVEPPREPQLVHAADAPVRSRGLPRPRAAKPPAPQVATAEPAPADPAPANPIERRERAVARARGAGFLGGIRAEDIRAITGTVDLEKAMADLGPVYREHEAAERGFGGGRRFDPTKDPRFGTVATGRYETVATGRSAGAYYDLGGSKPPPPPPQVELCARGACTAVGGTDRGAVTMAMQKQLSRIIACYERATQKTRGEVLVTFEISEDGKVKRARGRGLGAIGTCVAGVVSRLEFAWGHNTKVSYPVAFQPAS